METIDELFEAFTNDSLDEAGRSALNQWLRASEANVDRFVRDWFVHCQLFVIAGQRDLHASVMDAPAWEEPVAGAPGRGAVRAVSPRRLAGPRQRWWFAAAAASAAIAVATVAWVLAPPAAVAQLSQATTDARWADPATGPAVGALLHAGDVLRLERGRAQATLVSGAKIVLVGPAVLRIDGESAARLESGRVGFAIPPQATGLRVETPLGRFLDLGTEFTLDLEPQHGFRLYVFSGLVDVQPSLGARFQVPQSRGVSYDAATGEAKVAEFGDSDYIAM